MGFLAERQQHDGGQREGPKTQKWTGTLQLLRPPKGLVAEPGGVLQARSIGQANTHLAPPANRSIGAEGTDAAIRASSLRLRTRMAARSGRHSVVGCSARSARISAALGAPPMALNMSRDSRHRSLARWWSPSA